MTNEQFLVELADFLKSHGVTLMAGCSCCDGINIVFSQGKRVVDVSYVIEGGIEQIALTVDDNRNTDLVLKRKTSGKWVKRAERRIDQYRVERTWSPLEMAE